ncbi:SWI/SNF-related matrix-associated actin-dependent regulator of chromatin subfamily A-like protein 1 [Ischnura elegans]|uniref:SWI/SNF-related matrix-associated actin-dependent regulator of chromatin subfamily A-like protein 1 n=1 Tax=Ischnura elegans TaxID=197161 RepID=UPI001ED8735D|nr:SWI/SNF-related matrix-associated actin-dependent regulator of chromatin subfamily A-like protein 1 [Ischnura elegans]
MSSLTEEQRLRMEKNRQEALRKRAAKSCAQIAHPVGETSSDSSKKVKLGGNSSSLTNFYQKSDRTDGSGNGSSYLDISKTVAHHVDETSSDSTKKNKLGENSSSVPNFYQKLDRADGLGSGSSYQKLSNTQCSIMKLKKELITGHCKLIKRDRFAVDVGYHTGLINVFKSLSSSSYDPSSKSWNFNLADHGKLMNAVSSLKDQVSISPLPKIILETFLMPSKYPTLSSIDLSKIEPVLLAALMPFQEEGVRYGISRNGRCLIADEMGLGKTIQALGIAHYYLKDWPLLIVCPSSVKYTWKEAIGKWLPSIARSGEDVVVVTTAKENLLQGKVVIMSTDMFSRSGDKLTRFQTIVVDESHSLKNSKSVRSQVAFKVLRNARRVILLSGTPALSKPIELYHQLTCIDKVGFPRMTEFGIRYCNGQSKPWGWNFSGASNMEELVLLLEERVMIRRLKSDVMEQLPEKIREVVILDPSAVNRTSKEMKSSFKNFQSKQSIKTERRGAMLEYFNMSGSAKIQAIRNYIEDLLEDDVKFICFAHHQVVLNEICKVLQQNGISFIRIDGSTPAGSRKELCDEFQLSEKCRVAVLSITAANSGITLSAASLIIFAELFWNPGILAQAEDRAHRIGQKSNVVVRYLVAEGTVDDYLWPLLQGKLEVLNQMGLSKESIIDADCTHQKDSLQREITEYFKDMIDDFEMP